MLGGVSAMPTSPGLGGFGSPQRPGTTPNGVGRHFDNMSTSQIKALTIEAVRRESKGAGALALLKAARTQIAAAHDYEAKGDLKNALASYTKGGTLVRAALDSTEYKRESAGGVVHKECIEFQKSYSVDMATRMSAIEEKLKALEKADDGPNTTSMGGIQDRIKALQNNGLPLADPPKRFAQQAPQAAKYPTPPTSPRVLTTPSTSSSALSSSPLVPPTPVSASDSPHALVSPASFGPPSPASTPSSSPVHMFSANLPSTVTAPPMSPSRSYSISSTEAKFPSIDELDESFALPSFPSVPTIHPRELPVPPDSSSSFRNLLPIERPSSTPVTPTLSSFVSRPGSPTKPQVPLKPSTLSTHPSSSTKEPLPNSGTAFPRELQTYLRDYKVLLLDVRNRADFDKAHIRTEAVVCVEPIILTRTGLTAERLEDSMVNAPTNETTMFKNRDKFDLIVVYDQSSQTLGSANSPMSILVRLISEQAFTKLLKRMPMMLIGGFDAWRRDVGEQATTTTVTPARSTPPNGSLPPPISFTSSASSSLNGLSSSTSMTNGVHGTTSTSNGFSSSTSMTNGFASSSSSSSMGSDPHQVWTPRSRADTNPPVQQPHTQHRPNYSLDQPMGGHSRSPAEITYPSNYQSGVDYSRPSAGSRRPTVSRAGPSAGPSSFPHTISENIASPPPMVNGSSSSSITYPSFAPRVSPSPSLNHASPPASIASPPIASPPVASINPTLSRRRSDYIDQSSEAVSSLHQRSQIPGIDYPSQHILRPPPAVASSALERQERPRGSSTSLARPNWTGSAGDPPRIASDYAPTYWSDIGVGTSGLKNLGNTCYMNAPIQCLSATLPFAQFFANGRWKNAVNTLNPMGSKGLLSGAFAKLVHSMWSGDLPYIIPIDFRKAVCHLNSQYNGSNQHDSQEFLSFLLDGIHEDLNRLLVQPTFTRTPEQEAELERLGPQIASEQEWRLWKTRNDSVIVDFFQGQFRNRLQCLTCQTTSTTYNVFSILQLPIPQGRSSKVPLQSCIDAFFNTEILDKDDAWDCPKCKTKRRATKHLSLARLPPILVIHLKRFEIHGRFSDKIDTFVDYPLKSLDLTNFMPPPLPPGADKSQLNTVSPDDPRCQLPPYKYNLYGVTNHSGNLTSGHYTAYIADRDGWKSCDDSSIRPVDEKQVVNQRAYVLFYKRMKTP